MYCIFLKSCAVMVPFSDPGNLSYEYYVLYHIKVLCKLILGILICGITCLVDFVI